MIIDIHKIFNLDKKTVILTGSAGRLGSRFSHVLSAAGADVVLVDIVENENRKLEQAIKQKYKTNPSSFTIDINKESDIKKLKNEVLKKYKKIDVLINNAHFVPRNHPMVDAPFEKYPVELWEKSMSDNLRSIFLCCREFGSLMAKQKKGVIVNISSIYGIVGPDQRIYGKSRLNSPASYSTYKGGVVNLTRYLAAYWHRKNIRVNTLTLGGVYDKGLHQNNKDFVNNYSEKTILGRMANKEDYDGAILFLSSNASAYMTGSNLVVDGGWTAW